jgi:hypothetical protein
MNRERREFVWPQRPAFAPVECIGARSGVNESLSVLQEYDQQRRTFREAVCEEWAGQQALQRACEQRGASSFAQSTEKNSEVMSITKPMMTSLPK